MKNLSKKAYTSNSIALYVICCLLVSGCAREWTQDCLRLRCMIACDESGYGARIPRQLGCREPETWGKSTQNPLFIYTSKMGSENLRTIRVNHPPDRKNAPVLASF